MIIKEPRKLRFNPSSRKLLELPSLLAEMEKQYQTN